MDVETGDDLRQSKIYISVMGTPEEKKDTIKALTSASGYLHRELTKRLSIRSVPFLVFVLDETIERADRLTRLIDQVRQEDRSLGLTDDEPAAAASPKRVAKQRPNSP